MPRVISLAAILLIAFLVAPPAPAASAPVDRGLGAGIFAVHGTATLSLTLPASGAYYLTVAGNGTSSTVGAQLFYNQSLVAQETATYGSSTLVSLPAGNYALSLSGEGRAALGWDFTRGAQQSFPDNESLVAFLVPSGPRLHVSVAMGDAQAIRVLVYDDTLTLAANVTVTSDSTVTVDLAYDRASIAYLVASVLTGNPNGIFGLSYTAETPPSLRNLWDWPYLSLWIGLPILAALAAFVILDRRKRRGRARPRPPS